MIQQKTNIGIIGMGRFGQLVNQVLSKSFDVSAYDKRKIRGIKNYSLKDVAEKELVIVAVPISEFENTIKKIKKYLKKDAVIIDVCSVKEHPVNVMKKELPRNVSILATHPMFGPDSAKNSLKDKKIVLCPIRIKNKELIEIKKYLRLLGLKIIEMTPKEHDKQIAKSQLLTHFIGRSLLEMNAKPTAIDTEGYKRLMHILGVVQNDTWQLFEDMNKYNKEAKKVREKIIKSIKKVDSKVNK